MGQSNLQTEPAPPLPRILFVDDEPNILKALRRGLRRQRGRWDMSFVPDATCALEHMLSSPVDIVVTDVSMPAIDGITLLTRVREEYPETVRLLLSGTVEGQVGMKAVPVAHQFLAKPWDLDELIEALERACELRELLNGGKLRGIIGQMSALPSLPVVYQQLTAAIENPESTFADIVHVAERDPAITARLLQLVNSAFFAPAQPATNVREAVRYLGTTMLRNLVLATELFRMFKAEKKSAISTKEVQNHALRTALVASACAPRELKDKAFTAGILHDIGILIVASELPEQWRQISAMAHSGTHTLPAAELEVLGVTHAEIGAYLLGIWGIPREIVEAVANHHYPGRTRSCSVDVLALVHVANGLVNENDERENTLDMEYLERAGVLEQLDTMRTAARRVLDAD